MAGIDRTELLLGSPDLMPFDFRSWRTTGCTWLAMLGTNSYVIAQQAGHKSPDTTWGSYIKRGSDLRQRHGEPFPPLPASLLESSRAVETGGNNFGSRRFSVPVRSEVLGRIDRVDAIRGRDMIPGALAGVAVYEDEAGRCPRGHRSEATPAAD